MSAVLVFVGGGTGAVLRWCLSLLVTSPFGTLLANLIGSAMLAALMHPSVGLDPRWQLTLGTGCLGGFTTYSTFNLEVIKALQAGQTGQAVATALGTMVGCLLAGMGGWWVAGMMRG